MASVTESERFADSAYGSSESNSILDAATKDLFRKNAFRITGLAVDATPRDLAKHAEKLRVLAELGQDPHPTAAFPLRPAPTLEEIRSAIQKLKDPEKRLIDEFFWFWPQNFGESRLDPAIEALQKGLLQNAADIWMSKRKDPTEGVVATHNLALIFHIEALDGENYCLSHDVDVKQHAEIKEYWKAAFYRWNQILAKEQLWEGVTMRIRQLNEPNLTTAFGRRMRVTVPAALVKINAELAVAFAEAGKAEPARVHTELMDGMTDAAGHVGKTTELVLASPRKRLLEHIRNAKENGDKNPSEAMSAARELLDHTRSTLSLFDLFVSKNAHLRNDAFDEVAETCNRLQVTYHKATNDNETCLEFLKTVLPLAASEDLREQIESNIQVLTENIAAAIRDKKLYGNLKPISSVPSLSTINGIGFTLYGSTDVDNTNGSYLTTYYFSLFFIPIFPIRRYRVIPEGNSYRFLGKAPLRSGDKWHLAIALGIIGWFVISVAISSKSQSASSSGSPRYSSSSYSSRSSLSSTKSGGNADEWDSMREQLRLRALATERAEIEASRPTVQALEDQVENLAREIERDRAYLDRTSKYQVDAFNTKLRRYKALLQEAKNTEEAFNQKVNSYNAKLRGSTGSSSAPTPQADRPKDTAHRGAIDPTPTVRQTPRRVKDLVASPTPERTARLVRSVRVKVNDHDVVLKAGLKLRVLGRSGRDVMVYYDYAAVTIPASATDLATTERTSSEAETVGGSQLAIDAPGSALSDYRPKDTEAGLSKPTVTPTATATDPNLNNAVSAPETRPVGTIRIEASDTLNVRADASASSRIVGTLRSGDHVYLETERVVNAGKGVPVTWQKITSFTGYGGWVNADFISTGEQ